MRLVWRYFCVFLFPFFSSSPSFSAFYTFLGADMGFTPRAPSFTFFLTDEESLPLDDFTLESSVMVAGGRFGVGYRSFYQRWSVEIAGIYSPTVTLASLTTSGFRSMGITSMDPLVYYMYEGSSLSLLIDYQSLGDIVFLYDFVRIDAIHFSSGNNHWRLQGINFTFGLGARVARYLVTHQDAHIIFSSYYPADERMKTSLHNYTLITTGSTFVVMPKIVIGSQVLLTQHFAFVFLMDILFPMGQGVSGYTTLDYNTPDLMLKPPLFAFTTYNLPFFSFSITLRYTF